MIEFIRKKINIALELGFFHIFGANIFSKLLGFVLISLMAKILSKEDLGTLGYFQSILNLVNPLLGCGVFYGLFIYSSRIKTTSSLLKFALKTATFCNLLVVFLLFLFLFSIPTFISNSFTLFGIFALLLASKLLQNYAEIFISLLRANKRNKTIAILSTINTIAFFLLSFTGTLILNLLGFALGSLISKFIYLLTALYKTIKYTSTTLTFINTYETLNKKHFLFLSLTASITNIFSLILYNIDLTLIGFLLREKHYVADYYIASLIPFNLTIIPVSILVTLSPYIAHNYKNVDWIKSLFFRLLILLFTINAFIVFILYYFAEDIIILLFGEKYLNSVIVFKILLLGYLISGTFRISFGNILSALGLAKYNLINTVISGLINVLLSYLFIKLFGLIGAAVSTLLVIIISSGLGGFYLVKYLKDAKI